MVVNHTPGPWFYDADGNIWRRPLMELYEKGGPVAGERSLAMVSRGWFHEGSVGFPVEANARLIAAAPELLHCLDVICEHASGLNLDSRLHLDEARAAIKKARGK